MRNVLNTNSIDRHCQRLAEDLAPHVSDWVTSTYRKWLIQKAPAKAVLDPKILNNPLVKVIQALLGEPKMDLTEVFHFPSTPLPAWAVSALEGNEEVVYVELGDPKNRAEVQHWIDYLGTLPGRQISLTVEDVKVAVAKWDLELARQELISTMVDGVVVINHQVFEDCKRPVVLVRLVTKEAFNQEGAAMEHCLGRANYFSKPTTEIYSLREPGSAHAVATIEVNTAKSKPRVLQVEGYRRTTPPAWASSLLEMWFDALGWEKTYAEKADDPDEDDEYLKSDEDDWAT